MVILLADNYQLPSIDEGAFYSLEQQRRQSRPKVEELFVQNGMDLSLEFGKDAMILAQSKRVLKGQVQLQQILDGVRDSLEETLSVQDAEYLCSFQCWRQKMSPII